MSLTNILSLVVLALLQTPAQTAPPPPAAPSAATQAAQTSPAAGEIEDARWVSRAEVRAALAAGGEIDGLILPGPTSIARHMLSGWAAVSD